MEENTQRVKLLILTHACFLYRLCVTCLVFVSKCKCAYLACSPLLPCLLEKSLQGGELFQGALLRFSV